VKFPQLPVGRRFQYQGETLVKVGPLTACGERGGNTRMIPRSALVVPLSEGPDRSAGEHSDSDRSRLQVALGHFEARWRAALQALDEPARGLIEPALAEAQSDLLKELSPPGPAEGAARI